MTLKEGIADFGSNAGLGKDFEEKGMGSASVDEVDFFDAAGEGVEGGGDLGNHASGDRAVVDEIAGLFFGDRFDEG